MKITLETIPHKDQRYETCGDWFYDDAGDLHIKVSELGDWRMEALVKLHELIEVMLCEHSGITQKQVDEFDFEFEKNRPEGSEDEPGDSPTAPYFKQHGIASGIERLLAAEFGVDWEEYARRIESLRKNE